MAHQIHLLKALNPYTDYQPYKNVLGYYLFLPSLSMGSDRWSALIFAKVFGALSTSMIFGWVIYKLKKWISPSVLIISSLILFFAPTYFIHASNLRADIFCGLFGLVALLLMMDKKMVLSGLMAGLAFLCSQKGALYIVSLSASAGIFALRFPINFRSFRPAFRFVGTTIIVILFYSIFWWIMSDGASFQKGFVESPLSVMSNESYTNARRYLWGIVLNQSPILVVAGILAWVVGALAMLKRSNLPDHLQLSFGFSLTFFPILAMYKFPWPYSSLIYGPIGLISIVSALDILRSKFIKHLSSPKAIIPFALITLSLFSISLFPYTKMNQENQKYHFQSLKKILAPTEHHLATFSIMYDIHDPLLSQYRWMDQNRLKWFRQLPLSELKKELKSLKQAPISVILERGRMGLLPAPLFSYLRENYSRISGNLLIYSPYLRNTAKTVDLKFSGRYKFKSSPMAKLKINEKLVSAEEILDLNSGPTTLEFLTEDTGRLQFLPHNIDWRNTLKDNPRSNQLFRVMPQEYLTD